MVSFKKLAAGISLLSLLLNPSLCFAALDANIIWEVRTTGNANNSCGFKSGASGTDYSQQNSVQITRTDLVIGNPTTTSLTSAGTPFTTAEVGNLINITAGTGFTTGYYEITAVDGSNVATVDRSAGTAGSTGGTGYVGGACVSFDTAVDNGVGGNDFYVKAGTYNETVSVTALTDAPNGNETRFIGYNTTRTDQPTGANRPLIDCASTRTNGITFTNMDGISIENFIVEDCTGDGILVTNSAGDELRFVNVLSRNNGSDGWDVGRDATWIGCESHGNTGEGINPSNTRTYILLGNYLHDNGSRGIENGTGSVNLTVGNIFDSNSNDGLHENGAALMHLNNTFYNNTGAGSDGYSASASASENVSGKVVVNNTSSSNGQYGFNFTNASVTSYFNFNNYFDHTTELNNVSIVRETNTGDTDPLLTNPASGDFTLQSGSPLEDAGLGVDKFTGVTGDYHWNIGASQDDTQSGGSGVGVSALEGGLE
jgi:hypothetical protein